MTRVYNKGYVKRKEEELVVNLLHKIAKRIEVKADKVGYNIDNDQEWIAVHEILLSWEFDGGSIPIPGIYDRFERIATKVGYNFWGGFCYYIERIAVQDKAECVVYRRTLPFCRAAMGWGGPFQQVKG